MRDGSAAFAPTTDKTTTMTEASRAGSPLPAPSTPPGPAGRPAGPAQEPADAEAGLPFPQRYHAIVVLALDFVMTAFLM